MLYDEESSCCAAPAAFPEPDSPSSCAAEDQSAFVQALTYWQNRVADGHCRQIREGSSSCSSDLELRGRQWDEVLAVDWNEQVIQEDFVLNRVGLVEDGPPANSSSAAASSAQDRQWAPGEAEAVYASMLALIGLSREDVEDVY